MRWLFYLFRLLMFRATSMLQFFGKPGSRIIVPALIAAVAFLARPYWHAVITAQLRTVDPGLYPETIVLDVMLIVSAALLGVAYAIGSKLFALIFGAFPLAQRPLPPPPKIAVERPKTEEASAVVRIVVPPLPKRRE